MPKLSSLPREAKADRGEHFRHRLARWFCAMYRFGSVRVANRVFRVHQAADSLVYRRQLFGQSLELPVERSVTHQLLYLLGERAVPEKDLVRRYVQPGMRVVDVGANLGYYAAMLQESIGVKGQLTLIEPSRENLMELKHNIELNGWGNTRLYECAVGSHEATMGLLGGLNSGVVAYVEHEESVQMRTLDSIIDEIEVPVDFIKIDVEGYEWDVLQGAEDVIARDRPILFVEIHPLMLSWNKSSVEIILEFLKGYYDRLEFFDLPDNDSIFSKFMIQYFGKTPCRRINIQDIPEEFLHAGRQHGTFWLVCLPTDSSEKH